MLAVALARAEHRDAELLDAISVQAQQRITSII